MINEKVLGHFLRYKRNHAQLAEFAIHPTRSRRTPGLTREEVAELAHVSTDWYTRIEQGRTGATPSPDVLRDLCQALRLNNSETAYAFNLVGLSVPRAVTENVNDDTLTFMRAQMPTPAFVMDQELTILAANPAYQRLFDWQRTQSGLARNWVWRVFQSDAMRQHLSDWTHYAAYATAVFRQVYSLTPDSQPLYDVFTAIKADPIFRQSWDVLAVTNFATQHLLFNDPELGELYLIENTLQVPATKQYLVIANAGDADTKRKLARL